MNSLNDKFNFDYWLPFNELSLRILNVSHHTTKTIEKSMSAEELPKAKTKSKKTLQDSTVSDVNSENGDAPIKKKKKIITTTTTGNANVNWLVEWF